MASNLQIAIELLGKDAGASAVLGAVTKGIGALPGLAGSAAGALGGIVDGLGRIGLAAQGITAIASGVGGLATSLVSGNAEMERYEVQLGTLMGSADAARERLAELAKFGAETPFELPEIARAEKVLLGFGLTGQKAVQLTGKSGTELRTVLGDIAAGTGASFEEIALTFGKFSSGATGEAISRLQELGIVTREQMRDMGIEFSKSGELISPLPEAMAVAVQIAEGKFGGGMKALSQTFEGQMSTLADNFNQAKVAIMAPIFDVLKESLAGLNQFLSGEGFQDWLKGTAALLAGTVKSAVDSARMIGYAWEALFEIFQGGGDLRIELGEVLENLGIGPELSDRIHEIARQAGDAFRTVQAVFGEGWAPDESIDPVVNAIGRLATFARDVLIPNIRDAGAAVQAVLGGDFARAGELVLGNLQRVTAALLPQLQQWAAAFLGWVQPMIPPLLAQLEAFAQQAFAWVQAQVPGWLAQLQQWGLALWGWVQPQIGPLLATLGELAGQAWAWVQQQAPGWLAQLQAWGQQFVAWVQPMIPPLLAELGRLAGEAFAWIASQIGPLTAQLLAWGQEFVAWVGPQIPVLLGRLGELAGSVWAWIDENAPSLATHLYSWVVEFIGWVAVAAVAILPKLLEFVGKIGAWIITTGVPELAKFAGKLGLAILDGVVQGLANFGTKLSAVLLEQLRTIRVRVGPFSISAEGFTVDMPSLPGSVPAAAPGGQRGGDFSRLAVGDAGAQRGGADLLTVNPGQFAIGLPPDQAAAACGPYAALVFAAAVGRYPSAAEAIALARQVGWTPGQGMAGPQSQLALLSRMGISAVMGAMNTQSIDASLATGRPVAISTPRHYFAITGGSAAEGYQVGGSGTALRGGKPVMTVEEMAALGGGINGVIYLLDQVQQQAPAAVAAVETVTAAATQAPATPFEKFQQGLQPVIEAMSNGTQYAYDYQKSLVQLASEAGIMPELFTSVANGGQSSADALAILAAKLGEDVNPMFAELAAAYEEGRIGSVEFTAKFLDMAAKLKAAAPAVAEAAGAIVPPEGAEGESPLAAMVTGAGALADAFRAVEPQIEAMVDRLKDGTKHLGRHLDGVDDVRDAWVDIAARVREYLDLVDAIPDKLTVPTPSTTAAPSGGTRSRPDSGELVIDNRLFLDGREVARNQARRRDLAWRVGPA